MADLILNNQWVNDVYQLEETDVVRGGDPAAGGVSNIQAQQLGNRTGYLYNLLGRFEDIIQYNVSTDVGIIWNLSFKNKVQALRISVAGKTIKLLLDNCPQGGIIAISTINDSVTEGKSVRFTTDPGIQFVGLPYSSAVDQFYLHTGESIVLVRKGNYLHVISLQSQMGNVGEIVHAPFAPRLTIACSGQLVNRIDYPRLWQRVLESSIAVTDADWVNNIALQGKFSLGNGTTTFRIPDLRATFIRNADNGKGADLDRLSTGEGSYQTSKMQNHKHKMFDKVLKITAPTTPIVGDILKVPLVSGTNINIENLDTDTAIQSGGYLFESRPVNHAFTAWMRF